MLCFRRAFGIAVGSMAASVFVLNPLVRGPYSRPGASVFEETLGPVVLGTVALAFLVAPALFVVRRVAGQVRVPRGVGAAVGGLVAMVPWIALNQPGATTLEKIVTTFEGLQTSEGFAVWGPYLLGGAVLGWHMSAARQGVSSTSGTP